uniref:Uncharacterized protein n=1 Tax=Moniliophthora roreri TaxID=221103 RepID=A0A0W0GBZ8_MONRR
MFNNTLIRIQLMMLLFIQITLAAGPVNPKWIDCRCSTSKSHWNNKGTDDACQHLKDVNSLDSTEAWKIYDRNNVVACRVTYDTWGKLDKLGGWADWWRDSLCKGREKLADGEYPHSLTNGDGNGPRIPIILPRIGLTEIQAASEQLIPITPRTHLSHFLDSVHDLCRNFKLEVLQSK